MKTTKQVLTEMLTECTGTAMCDSGGVRRPDGTTIQGYGRNWERNEGKSQANFENESEITLEFDSDGNVEYYTISVFHYLCQQLEINELCERFNQLNNNADNWDDDRFYGVSKEAGKYLGNINVEIGSGFNSYNGESSLSQVIQGTYIAIGGECYLVLQIHGGCDVRGGYTTARLFKLENEYTYDGGYLNPEDVYGIFIPNDTDLETPCFDGEVSPEVAGVIEFSNCYDGYTLNRIHNDWSEFELNRNKGKIVVGLI